MSLQAVTARNVITLAGSAKTVAEFFAYAVNRFVEKTRGAGWGRRFSCRSRAWSDTCDALLPTGVRALSEGRGERDGKRGANWTTSARAVVHCVAVAPPAFRRPARDRR